MASAENLTVYDFPLQLLNVFGCRCKKPKPLMTYDVLRDVHKCECGGFYTPQWLEERVLKND